MTKCIFNLNTVDPSWHNCLQNALSKMNEDYLQQLQQSHDWLPGSDNIFNAFSLPVSKVQYVLFGESPYPRKQSANGFAFWDQAVKELWSNSGMSKPVNRATSLRNIIKTLLVAEGMLNPLKTGQEDIAQMEKSHLVQTNTDLFHNFLKKGFLLLNATPVFRVGKVRQDAAAWKPFVNQVLDFLCREKPEVSLILFGNIANSIDKLIPKHCLQKLYAEHPYNHTFIQNKQVVDFFSPLHLLRKE